MPLVHKDLPRAYYVPGAVRTGEFCNESTGQMCPPSGAAMPWGGETLNTAIIGAPGTGWHLAGSGPASELRGWRESLGEGAAGGGTAFLIEEEQEQSPRVESSRHT